MPRARNPRARASVVVGVLSLLAVPAGVLLARYSERVTLVQAGISAAVGLLLGAYAILLARRGRETVEQTIGRSGGARAAHAGRLLGMLGICVALTGALAVGFYGLLTLFAD